jgi:AcrR family transcriptional regulator
MGRRSTHTPEELRELIVDAARSIIQKDGLAGLSARTIAHRIGYSPGTLYNVFKNLDDLILNVEARLLDELDARLTEVNATADPTRHMQLIAHEYLAFTQQHPRLWNLLFEHNLPTDFPVPDWYREKLETLLKHVENAMLTSSSGRLSGPAAQRAARVMWAGVHGITSLATADKLTNVTNDGARALIDDLLVHYIRGLDAAA